MSWSRRDRARFDRWTGRVRRGVLARQAATTWRVGAWWGRGITAGLPIDRERHPEALQGNVMFWLGSEPDEVRDVQARGSWPAMRLTFPGRLYQADGEDFVHPSWRHPSPAPLTKRSKRGRPVPSTQLKRAARRYQREHGVPYMAALRAVQAQGQVQQETRKEAPMKINNAPRMSGGKEDGGTADARKELEKLVEAEENKQGGGK